jgi:hypothetical protein
MNRPSRAALTQPRTHSSHPERPEVLYGRVVKIESSYPREVRVPSPVLAIVLVAASAVRLLGQLIARVLGSSGPGAGRSWKDLRKGPEFLVTPVLLRDLDQQLVPMEIHGHMSTGALVVTDRVRASVRYSRDPTLPARAIRIENLTTGRMLVPRGANLWSHLGLGLMLQAVLGAALIGLTLACLLGAF